MADERLFLTAELRTAAGISRSTMDYFLRRKLIVATSRGENGQLLFDAAARDHLMQLVANRRRRPDQALAQPAGQARLYLTAELRAAANISRTTMDYYLRQGLIAPIAYSENGFQLFDSVARARLLRIVALRRQGLSLQVIRQTLAEVEEGR